MSKPFVSVLTPTYNRNKFIPYLVKCYRAQTYPKESMEWILFDDGPESCEKVFLECTKGLPNIRYIHSEDKLTIGAKRNRLNSESKGEICVAMDDDDYYCPERVAHAVSMFKLHPEIDLAGSSQIFIFYTASKHIISLGPYNKNHATNGTFAYRKKYGKTHSYDEHVTHAEEKSFLENYIHPMIQLDPMKVMLVMSHSENTFNKDEFLKMALDPNNTNPLIKISHIKLNKWIRDKTLRDFYSSA